MAKRGRPSKKTLKKRKEIRAKSKRILVFAFFLLIILCALGYYLLQNKGL